MEEEEEEGEWEGKENNKNKNMSCAAVQYTCTHGTRRVNAPPVLSRPCDGTGAAAGPCDELLVQYVKSSLRDKQQQQKQNTSHRQRAHHHFGSTIKIEIGVALGKRHAMRALDARTQRRNVRVQAHVFHLAHDLCDICLFTADAEQLVQARAELVPSDPNVRPLHIVVVCVSGHCQGKTKNKTGWMNRERECVCVSTRACMSVCVCVWGKQTKKEKRRGSADRQKSIQSKSNKVEKSHNNGWFLFVVDVKRQQRNSNNSNNSSSSSSSNNRRDSRPTSQPGEAGGRCGGTSREGRVKHKKGDTVLWLQLSFGWSGVFLFLVGASFKQLLLSCRMFANVAMKQKNGNGFWGLSFQVLGTLF